MYVEYYKDINNPSRRNKIIKEDELDNYINSNIDCYTSLFSYDKDILEHVKKTGSVSGFKGPAIARFLIFDFDSDSNVQDSLDDAKRLISKLIKEYGLRAEEIRLAFSGNKGFSIEIPTKGLTALNEYDKDTPFLIRSICCKLAEGLNTADRVIYQHNRLFRLAGTRHQKSGLYKNHLSLNWLKEDISKIKEYCNKLQPMIKIEPIANTEKLNLLIADIITNGYTTETIDTFHEIDIDTSSLPACPSNKKYCIHMLEQGIETTERHNALMRIAVNKRQKGYGWRTIKGMLEDTLERMNQHNPEKASKDPFDPNMLQRIVTDAFKKMSVEGQEIYQYSYGCNCPTLVKYCNAECYLQKSKKISKRKLYKVGEMSNSFINYMSNYEKNIISSGLKTLEARQVNFFRGTMNLIVGRSGSGKTTAMLNVLRNSNKQGVPSVFFSLDMHRDMIFQKMLTFCSPYDLKQVQQTYKDKDKDTIQMLKDKYLLPAFRHTYFNFETKLSLAEVSDYVKLIEEETKKKVGFVVIDYASKLWSDFKSEYEKESSNAQWAADIAKELNICLLIIAQTSRAVGGDGITPMGNGSAKGSGVWDAETSLQLNVFRPFRIAEDYNDNIMGVEIAKNRCGPEGIDYLHWNGAKSEVRDFTPEEYEHFLKHKSFMPKKKKYSYGSD